MDRARRSQPDGNFPAPSKQRETDSLPQIKTEDLPQEPSFEKWLQSLNDEEVLSPPVASNPELPEFPKGRRKGAEDWYQEVYGYLKNNDYIPPRIAVMQGRAKDYALNSFKQVCNGHYKLSRDNHCLSTSKLAFHHKPRSGQKVWVIIPYKSELQRIITRAHAVDRYHRSIENTCHSLEQCGVFWPSYIKDVSDFIEDCVCMTVGGGYPSGRGVIVVTPKEVGK